MNSTEQTLKVFTFVGRDTSHHPSYFEDKTNDKGKVVFRIPERTVLFYATAGITREATRLSDLVSGTTSVYNTFHAAVMYLTTQKVLSNAMIYVLVVEDEDIYVTLNRGGSKRNRNPLLADAVNINRPSQYRLMVSNSNLSRLIIRYAVPLPMQPFDADNNRFPEGLFVADLTQHLLVPDSSAKIEGDPFNIYVAETQHTHRPDLRISSVTRLSSLLKNNTNALAFALFRSALRRDQYATLPGTRRILDNTWTDPFHITMLCANDVEDDHARFLQLCASSKARNTGYTEAGLFAMVRGVGHWPNRITYWINHTTSSSRPDSPGDTTLYMASPDRPATVHKIRAGIESVGFVCIQVGATHPKWAQLRLDIMASADVSRIDESHHLMRLVMHIIESNSEALLSHCDLFSLNTNAMIHTGSQSVIDIVARATTRLLDRDASIENNPYASESPESIPIHAIAKSLTRQLAITVPHANELVYIVNRPCARIMSVEEEGLPKRMHLLTKKTKREKELLSPSKRRRIAPIPLAVPGDVLEALDEKVTLMSTILGAHSFHGDNRDFMDVDD